MANLFGLFSTSAFMPHGHCYLWQPSVLWAQVVSDGLIGLAYFAIPFILYRFLKARPDIEFRPLFLLFVAFILLCGGTHFLAVVNVWYPFYYLDSVLKAATAVVSVLAAIRLAFLLPQIIALPSPAALKTANEKLRRLSAEKEKANEERFQLALEASPNAILVADAENRIAFANAQTQHIFGYSQEELLNQPLDVLIPKASRQAHAHHVEGFRQEPQMRFMGAGREVRGLRKSGEEFPAEIALGPFRYAGQLNVIAFVADISGRKSAEDKILRQSSELARSNQDLESFAYAASHDLQEPLRGMLGYLQLLQRQFQKEMAPKAVHYLEQAIASGGRMRTLMEALLQYSRIGRTSQLHPIRLESLLDAIAADLHAALEECGAELRYDNLPTVQYDALELRQVFQNLISNAVKFRTEAPPLIRVAAEKRDDGWVFSVSDNGIGIPEEFHGKLFQLFQRLHSRAAYPGSGIGLALVAKAIRSHGGRIWVESNAAGGTTFYFTFGPDFAITLP